MSNQTGYPSKDKPWMKYYEEYVDNEFPSAEKNIYTFLRDENKKYEDHKAITFFGNKILFSSLENKIKKCAESLSSMGVGKGDIVTIQALTMPQVVILFYALGYLGAVANLLYISADEKEVVDIINNTGSKLYFVIDKVYEKLNKSIENTDIKRIVLLSVGDEADVCTRFILSLKKSKLNKNEKTILWHEFLNINGSCPEVCCECDLPAAMVYTSGTTGKSKTVVLSHKSINALALQYMKTGIKFIVEEKFMNAIPIFVAYGLVFGVHVPLCEGLNDILVVDPNPMKIGKTYLKYKPVYFIQGVAGVENVIKNAEIKNIDMSFVKVLGVGGDAVPNAFVEKVNDFLLSHNSNIKLVIGYGMTEVAATVVSSTPLVNKFGTVGIPLPDTNIKIVRESTNEEIGYNRVGEICFNAPTMMIGYYKNDEETNSIIKVHDDGQKWVHSGDLGMIDEDGFVTVQGRIKRMIGIWYDGVYHKVVPQIVEKNILEVEGVDNAVVVGVKIDSSHNKLVSVINTSTHNSDDLINTIKEHNFECLQAWEQPAEYVVMDVIPRNAVGKVDVKKIEEILSDS